MRTPQTDEWMDLLQESGWRRTPARQAIVEVLLAAPRALEPLQVFSAGRARHANLGLVTVYRTLEKLEQLHLVQRVHHPSGCNLYLKAPQEHEHLLICSKCGRAQFFSGDDLEALVADITRQTGYHITDHWLQLYGECPECR